MLILIVFILLQILCFPVYYLDTTQENYKLHTRIFVWIFFMIPLLLWLIIYAVLSVVDKIFDSEIFIDFEKMLERFYFNK